MAVKILFAFYPLIVAYNHGIALLSSLCKQRGIEVDLCVLETIEGFRDVMNARDYDFVGFSAVTIHDFEKCKPFIAEAQGIGMTVLLGGVYARHAKPDKAWSKYIDFVCRGDGETLPDFLLSGDASLFTKRETCSNLNNLPFPDYELFKDVPFERGIPFMAGQRVLPYYSSRGCLHKCSFCLVRKQLSGRRLRTRVAEDLEMLRDKYHPDAFFMGDETLPYDNLAWRESWKDFRHPFFAYIRADIEPDLLGWLIDRGLSGCGFGVESGDEQHRNKILKKNLLDSQIYRTVEHLNKAGIQFVPFYMTGSPGETFTIRQKTFEMSRDIGGHPLIFKYETL